MRRLDISQARCAARNGRVRGTRVYPACLADVTAPDVLGRSRQEKRINRFRHADQSISASLNEDV